MLNIKKFIRKVIYGFMKCMPVKKDEVLLMSYYGAQYSGSPKYISLYLENHSDMNIVWAFTDTVSHSDYNGKSVRFGGVKYYYHLAVAGAIVTNYRMTDEFRKRRGQIYIQTWHSSLRLKMIEKDAGETLKKSYIAMAQNDSKQISYLLAGSKKGHDIFQNAFWYDGEICDVGTPQCDVLFEDRKKYNDIVKQHFGLSENCKIALYAPTFRKDNTTDIYLSDFENVRNALHERFGGEWVVLIRLHPHLINKINGLKYSENVLQATQYDDVQELLCAADVLFTDYSAVMFDYALTRRPCFLYTPDIDDYTRADRKLYFKIEDLPFSCAQTPEELVDSILSFKEQEYRNDVNGFISGIGSYDDGKSCERVFNILRRCKK